MIKNKHVVVAGLTVPVLALLGYFAAGHFFGEKPSAALEGQSYSLTEKPNCRWDSGRCGLKNADFELEISIAQRRPDRLTLQLESVFPLDGVLLALVRSGAAEPEPSSMRPLDESGLNWTLDIPVPDTGLDRLRLAASASDSYYYGDASTEFTRQ
jgi:hypothetical protein